MVNITVPQIVSMVGSNSVYLWMPEDSSGDLFLSVSYVEGSSTLPITKLVFKFDGVNETDVRIGSVSKVSLTGGHAYKVSADVVVSTTTTSIAMSTTPSLNISFTTSIDGTDSGVTIYDNKINLGYTIEGMEVESNDHVINGPVTDSGIVINNGTVYKVVDSSGHFGESDKDVSATISVDKDHAFYIVVKISAANNSGLNVKIEGYDSLVLHSENKSAVTYYIGIDSKAISYVDGSVGSLVAFQDKDLTITVETLNTGKPPTTELFIVQVPKVTGSST